MVRRSLNSQNTGHLSRIAQPDGPHPHWHIDASHFNAGGTFYYLRTVLDAYSCNIVHSEFKEQMKERSASIRCPTGMVRGK